MHGGAGHIVAASVFFFVSRASERLWTSFAGNFDISFMGNLCVELTRMSLCVYARVSRV